MHRPVTDLERLNLAGDYNRSRENVSVSLTLDEYILMVRNFHRLGVTHYSVRAPTVEEEDDTYVLRNDLDEALDRLTSS